MAETVVYTPENQANNALPWMLAGQNNGGFFGGNGGSAFWGALLGSVIPGVFGAWNGNGYFGGNGNGAASALGAQATANSNTELVLNAINGTDADVRLLASTLNTDVDSIKLGINTVQGAIAQVGSQVGMSGLQVINAINSGNASLASQLCECCCSMKQLVTSQGYENQLATLNQTNALSGAIVGSGQRTADAIADLKTTMVKEFCDARERDMAEKIETQGNIISQLRGQIDNANQTAAITGYINSLVSPIAKEVDDIKCKLPNTVSVNWPNLQAVNVTPYVSGGYYQGGYNGFYGAPGIGGFGNNLVF